MTVSLDSWEKKSNNNELLASEVPLPNITVAWRQAFQGCMAGKQCQGDPGLVPLFALLYLKDTLLSLGLLFHGHKIVIATPGIGSGRRERNKTPRKPSGRCLCEQVS